MEYQYQVFHNIIDFLTLETFYRVWHEGMWSVMIEFGI